MLERSANEENYGPRRASALQALGLLRDEIAALANSGAIYFERRGRHTVIAKLRFQQGGKTHSKYLGVDAGLVACVQSELDALQADGRRRSRLREVARDARLALKKTKAQLSPCLANVGFTFHGRQIRRCRKLDNNHRFLTNPRVMNMSHDLPPTLETTLVNSPAPENDPRLNLINQLIASAVEDKGDFLATGRNAVGAAAGDCLRTQYRLMHVIEQTFLDAPDAAAAINETRDALANFFRAGQLANQYIHLTIKMRPELGATVQPPRLLTPPTSEEIANSAPTHMGGDSADPLVAP